jgi:glucose-6-phosphate isomerase
VQAYVDRLAHPRLAELRDLLAARAQRPVTFGWGPRFLHSTGQYHKGGPATGVFLQITADAPADLEIPDRPFTFGQLIQAQAAGDATVLAEHGRPVLRLNLSSDAATTALFDALRPRT